MNQYQPNNDRNNQNTASFRPQSPQGQVPRPKKKNKNVGLIIGIILLIAVVALLVITLVIAGIVGVFIYNGNNKKEVLEEEPFLQEETAKPVIDTVEEEVYILPNFKGDDYTDVYTELSDNDIIYEINFEYSDIYFKDEVIRHYPSSGAKLEKYSTVILYVSLGEEKQSDTGTAPPEPPEPIYILEGSDCRYISEDELFPLSAFEVRLALNEIYARHGRIFKDAALSEYFNSQPWYNGTIAPESFNEGMLNIYEKENINLIVSYMDRMGYR